MNDEIKEILARLKNNDFERDCNNGSCYKELYLSEIEQLLDYITNLQKENERKERLITQYGEGMCAYANRIDKAIEYIDRETGKGIYESGYGRGTAITICKEHLLNILQNGSDNNV